MCSLGIVAVCDTTFVILGGCRADLTSSSCNSVEIAHPCSSTPPQPFGGTVLHSGFTACNLAGPDSPMLNYLCTRHARNSWSYCIESSRPHLPSKFIQPLAECVTAFNHRSKSMRRFVRQSTSSVNCMQYQQHSLNESG